MSSQLHRSMQSVAALKPTNDSYLQIGRHLQRRLPTFCTYYQIARELGTKPGMAQYEALVALGKLVFRLVHTARETGNIAVQLPAPVPDAPETVRRAVQAGLCSPPSFARRLNDHQIYRLRHPKPGPAAPPPEMGAPSPLKNLFQLFTTRHQGPFTSGEWFHFIAQNYHRPISKNRARSFLFKRARYGKLERLSGRYEYPARFLAVAPGRADVPVRPN